MKNKLNVAAAVFLGACAGVSLSHTDYGITGFNLALVLFNLYAAGFFED